ncbi:MAG TPA: diaminopimelate decarboxylase [Chloroflexota bacterium]
MEHLKPVLPITAEVNADGHLSIGGCDTVALAQRFGTPLYVYDEATLRARAREHVSNLQRSYPDSLVIYACKAFTAPLLLQIFQQEGLGLDVVSGGEIFAARYVGFPMDRVYFHGNNKTPQELVEAVEAGVGRVVVDGHTEIDLLNRVAVERGRRVPVMLRLSPGVEAHTHDYRKTGILDSKFGFPIVTGDAARAVARVLESPGLELVGFHTHVGSQIFDLQPYVESVAIAMDFAASMREAHGFVPREFSPGGGWGIAYTAADAPPPISEVVATLASVVRSAAEQRRLPLPRLVVEPGRSIVGPAGVALYTVGAIKDVPGIRRYVSVDGGMADNIRPALYGAKYEALVANRPTAPAAERVTIAGKYCESGDILLRDVDLPTLQPGDVLAVPASGAYNLAMASNYNMAPKPAVVLVGDGQARLMCRRQRYEELLQLPDA